MIVGWRSQEAIPTTAAVYTYVRRARDAAAFLHGTAKHVHDQTAATAVSLPQQFYLGLQLKDEGRPATKTTL